MAEDQELDHAARQAMLKLLLVQYEEDLRDLLSDTTLSPSRLAYKKAALRLRYQALVR